MSTTPQHATSPASPGVAAPASPAQQAAQDGDRASYRSIWRLAWPQLLMTATHFFIGFVDVLVAGRIDRSVQASLGLITQCLFFFLIVGVAMANGGVAAISQSMGARLEKRALRYVGLLLELAAGCGLTITLFGMVFQGPLLAILQAPPEIRPITEYFLYVYLFVLPAYYILLTTNAIFRARKQVFIPFFSMLVVTLANTFLDFGLGLGMFGLPDLGYQGVAWATFGSVSAGALFNIVMLARFGLLRRASFPPLRWVRPAGRYLAKVAWPAGVSQILWQTGYLALFAVVAALPRENVLALAGMTAGLRVESALFMPAFAFNMTGSVLVGHYLGAGDPAEARRAGRRVWAVGCGAITLLAVAVWQFVTPLVAFLAPDTGVQAQAHGYLLYNFLAVPFTVTSMIMGGIMGGAGATIYSMWGFGTATWLVRLPLAIVLGHWIIGGSNGVWMSMLASQIFQSALMLYIFVFKDWGRFAMRSGRNGKNGGKAPA